MATIDFKHSVGRVIFDAGVTEDGKLIQKTKLYRNIAEDVQANDLYKALEELAGLSKLPFIGAEKVETAIINN